MPAVDGLAVGLGGRLEGRRVDPAVLPGDLLGHGHGQVLVALHGAHELECLVEGLHGAGVQPGVAAAQGHHGEGPVVQVHLVQGGDLQLATGARLHLLGHLGHAAVVEVQAGDGVGALGVGGLLLNGDGVEILIELHHAEALGSSTW